MQPPLLAHARDEDPHVRRGDAESLAEGDEGFQAHLPATELHEVPEDVEDQVASLHLRHIRQNSGSRNVM